MWRKMMAIVAFLVTFTLGVTLAACGDGETGQQGSEVCIVTVSVGEETSAHKIVKGQRMFVPKLDLGEEDVFLGWYKGETEYDFHAPVEEDFTLTAKFAPGPKGTVTGVVRDEDGTPVVGAEIDYGEATATTDEYGRYAFDLLFGKDCRVAVRADGYAFQARYIPDADRAQRVDLTLRKNGVPAAERESDLTVSVNANVKAQLTRGDDALTVRLSAVDYVHETYATQNNTEEVVAGDRLEFYLDSKGNGGSFPQFDDWQFDVDADGYFRVLRGTGSVWMLSACPAGYLLERDCDLNGNQTGYTVTFTLPYTTFGLTPASDICFALGSSGSGSETPRSNWVGWTFNGEFTDPQVPAKYQRWREDGKILVQKGQSIVIEEEDKYFSSLAVLDAEKKSLAEIGAMLFLDDTANMLYRNLPERFFGNTSFVLANVNASSWRVRQAGYVFLFAPSVNYADLNAQIEEEGWTLLVEHGDSIGRDIVYPTRWMALNNLYVKWCEEGEEHAYAGWTLAFGGVAEDDEYYVFDYDKPSGIRITTGSSDDAKELYSGVGSSIAVTDTVFISGFGTGGRWEPDQFNYIKLRMSRDGGATYTTIMTIRGANDSVRTTDPSFFLNDAGKLIISWDTTGVYWSGKTGRFQMVVDNPADPVEEWVRTEPYRIWNGVAINAPLRIGEGEWLSAVGTWEDMQNEYIYRSTDDGLSWQLYSKAYLADLSWFGHESNIVRLPNGNLWMLTRGVAEPYYDTYSTDGGKTWSAYRASVLPGACSRGRLVNIPDSDKFLFISNADRNTRGHLTAYILSNNGSGPVIESSLLLDERAGASASGVAYPDVSFFDGGRKVLVTWDCDRTGLGEILGVTLTLAEIQAGGTLPKDRLTVISSNY